MCSIPDFDFGDVNVAEAYDAALVPVLFVPWADKLVSDHGPWHGKAVLDLACGTGVVTKKLGPLTGVTGQVVSTDFSAEMLRIAERNCESVTGNFAFVCCSADSLECPDSTFDSVVCQQGFQFFPDKKSAAAEIYRVLKPGGRTVISTWLPVAKCAYFGELCLTLEEIGQDSLSAKMRVPFDHMPANELKGFFTSVGFEHVENDQINIPLSFSNGIENAYSFVFSTPISAEIQAFTPATRDEFKSRFTERLSRLGNGHNIFGSMVSNVMTATR